MDKSYANATAVIIPAYKPDDRLPPYIAALREAGIGKIVIVDDGSGEEYTALFSSIQQDATVHLISYMPNAGKGVALKRGMEYIKDECPAHRFIVTADSDGQHTVEDVCRMAMSLSQNSEGLLLGSRDFKQDHVPPKSRMGNRITSVVFKLLYGHWVCDTQTGLRGFERKLLPTMIAVRGDRYEYEMNMLIECASLKIPMRPLTIETVYENNNERSHFRAVRDSARIYGVIFAGFFRFISASLISFLVDYGMYLLLNNFLKRYVPSLDNEFNLLFIKVVSRIALATVIARVVSGVANYLLNRKIVFNSKTSTKKTFPRYLCVFFLIMVLSAMLTSSMHLWFGWSEKIAKIPVDIALFFLSYYIQRKWVFIKEVELEETA